jgi:hypothetical protein
VIRREDLRNPSQHVGLSTTDRVLVGYRQQFVVCAQPERIDAPRPMNWSSNARNSDLHHLAAMSIDDNVGKAIRLFLPRGQNS